MTSSFWSLSNVHFTDLHPKNNDITKMKNEITKHQMSLIGVLSMFFMPRSHCKILRKCQNVRVVYVESKCK